MPYAIITFDKAGSAPLRDQLRADHMAYLGRFSDKLIVSGGLMSENDAVFGGCIVLDSDDVAYAEQFASNDPFAKAGLFEKVIIAKWRKGFLNFARWI